MFKTQLRTTATFESAPSPMQPSESSHSPEEQLDSTGALGCCHSQAMPLSDSSTTPLSFFPTHNHIIKPQKTEFAPSPYLLYRSEPPSLNLRIPSAASALMNRIPSQRCSVPAPVVTRTVCGRWQRDIDAAACIAAATEMFGRHLARRG
jgi:hypothetical protein